MTIARTYYGDKTYGAAQDISPHETCAASPVQILMHVIDHNAATNIKPYHMNKELMTTVLKLEAL